MKELDDASVKAIADGVKDYLDQHPEAMLWPPVKPSAPCTSLTIKNRIQMDRLRRSIGDIGHDTVEPYEMTPQETAQLQREWDELLLMARGKRPYQFRLDLKCGSSPIYGIVIAVDESSAIDRVRQKIYAAKVLLRNEGHYVDFDPDDIDLAVSEAAFDSDVIWMGKRMSI